MRFAIELLDLGRPFSAHEVFEARWKDAPEAEHDLWQGLAQPCVGLTHALRGNATGAERLLERGDGRLERYAAVGGPTYGLDLAEFRTRIVIRDGSGAFEPRPLHAAQNATPSRRAS